MQTFSVNTLGCKVNQYDGNAVVRLLRDAGLRTVAGRETADLVVLNTCCVTRTAMRKSRQAVGRLVRRNPGAAVAVVGCYSDYDAARIETVLEGLGVPPSRRLIVGHHDGPQARLEQFVRRLLGDTTPNAVSAGRPSREDEGWMRPDDSPGAPEPASIRTRRWDAIKRNPADAGAFRDIDRFENRQRAFVKIQDGCDAFCSYCIVPYTRCRVWSREPAEVLAECRRLVETGHRELVLSGVFLGAFGRATAIRRRWGDAPGPLADLLRSVGAIEGLWRVRLSSLEPGDLTDPLLRALAETPTAAPHLHLPLQSGSTSVLKRMNRQYAPGAYRRTLDRLRRRLDEPAITTDIIVGFPGESEEDFDATLEMARYAGFARIHAFPFSAVQPTAAWRWREQAPSPEVVRRRLARLADLERSTAEAYRRRFVGREIEALIERPRRGREGRREAMTDRYLKVHFSAEPHRRLTGRVGRFRITGVCDDGLTGDLLP